MTFYFEEIMEKLVGMLKDAKSSGNNILMADLEELIKYYGMVQEDIEGLQSANRELEEQVSEQFWKDSNDKLAKLLK